MAFVEVDRLELNLAQADGLPPDGNGNGEEVIDDVADIYGPLVSMMMIMMLMGMVTTQTRG